MYPSGNNSSQSQNRIRTIVTEVIAERMARPEHQLGGNQCANLPEWVRLEIASRIGGWAAGLIEVCAHLPREIEADQLGRGTLGIACAWMPNYLYCGRPRCTPLPVGDADHACDRCGRVFPGELYTQHVQTGWGIAFAWGCCSGCNDGATFWAQQASAKGRV